MVPSYVRGTCAPSWGSEGLARGGAHHVAMKRRRCLSVLGGVVTVSALGGCAILLGRAPVVVAFRPSRLPAPRTSHDASQTSSSFAPKSNISLGGRPLLLPPRRPLPETLPTRTRRVRWLPLLALR